MSSQGELAIDMSLGSDGERSSSSLGSPPGSPILKFSIDNILRPEFGNKSDPVRVCPTSNPSSSSAVSPTSRISPKTIATAMALNRSPVLWPAWVYCTRYSDRPSSGPRCRRVKRKLSSVSSDEKRPRTAFSSEQLNRLKMEFQENRYLTEKRRQELAHELGLNESQIKIWFQNKRAKIKKTVVQRPPLALHLMAQGLYNHATVPVIDDD